MSEPDTSRPGGEMIVYQTEDGHNRILVRLKDETVWLTQSALADLFDTTKQNISLHIKNIYEENELREESVVKEYLTTAADGKQYRVKHYSLETGCRHGEKLSRCKGNRHTQPNHGHVPRPGRIPRPAAAGYPHTRLGNASRQVSGRYGTAGARRPRLHQPPSGPEMGVSAIRRFRGTAEAYGGRRGRKTVSG